MPIPTTGSPGYVAGVSSSAIDLDGTDDYVTLPAGIASESEITIASWFWRDSTASWQRLFDFGTGTSEYMFLSPRSGGATIQFGIKSGDVDLVGQPYITPDHYREAKTLPNRIVTLVPRASVESFYLSLERPRFKDLAVREAL